MTNGFVHGFGRLTHGLGFSSLLAAALVAAAASSCSSPGGLGAASISTAPGIHDGDVENVSFVAQPAKAEWPTLTLAVKFVQYLDKSQAPVLSPRAVEAVNLGMNKLFAQCGIRFRVEEYLPADPVSLGLDYNTDSMGDLEKIRASFDTDRAIVVVNTGSWNHGSMGVANAWTTMPGMTPSGAVIEGPVAGDAPLVAHEVGHYLGLDHTSNTSNMMNPQIYDSSTEISVSQCEEARRVAQTDRAAALRT